MNKVTATQLKNWAEGLKSNGCGCCSLPLVRDDANHDWYICMGWQDGYDERETDDYQDGTWHICAKIAYQSHNNIMQCDYDIDFKMPVCNEYGDVDGAEVTVFPNENWEELADWLNKNAERIVYSYARFDKYDEAVA